MTVSSAGTQRFEHSIETQQRLARARSYNRWICDLIGPYINGRVLDIGSAIGNITRHFLDREAVVSLDIEPDYVAYLNATFGRTAPLRAYHCDIADPEVLSVLEAGSFQSAMCLNVIEHIPNHQTVLDHVATLLRPGGHFAVVAPAVPWIYGAMDAADHHCRRYWLHNMTELFEQAGFEIVESKYFNFVGALGWLYYGRILKREYIPAGPMLGLADQMIRLGRQIERIIPAPLGQSVLCVGRKPGRPEAQSAGSPAVAAEQPERVVAEAAACISGP